MESLSDERIGGVVPGCAADRRPRGRRKALLSLLSLRRGDCFFFVHLLFLFKQKKVSYRLYDYNNVYKSNNRLNI